MSCPVCQSRDVVDLLSVDDLPALCNQLCSDQEAARAVVRGDIRLVYCRSCGHIYNRAFDPDRIQYSADYENSLHCSGTFQSYADGLVQGLVDRYDLRNKRVMEVGCGQGDFLNSLCAAGDNIGFGFDPSYLGGNEDPRVTILPVSFAEAEFDQDIDFVCCRHVLEHIEGPREFLETLAAKLKPGTAVVFEVPNVLFTIRDGGIWDIIYEHCSYFSPSSLRRVFQLAGLRVSEVSEVFGGQFLVVHAEVSHAFEETHPVDSGLQGLTEEFSRTYAEKIRHWREALQQACCEGDRVVAWGAGSKGNTFLNVVGQDISAIVDVNPKKHSKFVAGTGQPILSLEQLMTSPPQTVVIMNPVYEQEIAECLHQLGCEPRFLNA